MKLVSTVSWSAFTTLIRLATGFVSIKIVAVIIGPYGIALVGQFNNFIQIIMTIALGGISTGLIKYTAQFKDNKEELYKIWRTAIWISLVMIIFTILLMVLFHNYLAITILRNKDYGIIFIIFAFTLILYVANNLMLGILNGMHEIKKFNILNMLNSILGLTITIFLVYTYHVFGALLALVTSQSITFFVIILFVIKSNWFKFNAFWGKFDKYYFKKLMAFTAMSVVSMCVLPTSQIFVRGYLAAHTSWQMAGCWQGLQKISDSYLMIVYAALGTYFLPKLANLEDNRQISYEISYGYKVIMPFVVGSGVLIYFLRDFIIYILFTKAFSPMRYMFFWQFFGDCFRIASYLLAYLMLAKSKTKIYIVTEILFGISFPVLSYIFINLFAANGAVMAFAVNYFMYFLLFVILYKKGMLF